jgi:hypothetical protein
MITFCWKWNRSYKSLSARNMIVFTPLTFIGFQGFQNTVYFQYYIIIHCPAIISRCYTATFFGQISYYLHSYTFISSLLTLLSVFEDLSDAFQLFSRLFTNCYTTFSLKFHLLVCVHESIYYIEIKFYIND